MHRMTNPLLALMLLVTLTGCGGSSVDLPDKVFNKDVYAIQWIDVTQLSPDDAKDLFNGLADDMSDDQPKARLWASAQADGVQAGYADRWEAFTEAGGQGALLVHTAKTTGEGDSASVERGYYVLLKVKKGTSSDELRKAIAEFAKEDNNEKIKFEPIDGTDGQWLWLTRENRPDGAPKLPSDGSEENAKAFQDLLKRGDGAAVISAWRGNDAIRDQIKRDLEKADDRNLSEEDKQRLKEAQDIQSVVMSVNAGSSASISATVEFNDKELAKAFAEYHNERLVSQRMSMKTALMNAENPPHPSVVDGIFEEQEVKASGKKIELELGSSVMADGMNVYAATMGQGRIGTADPSRLLPLHSALSVPPSPGVPSCYNIRFGD